MDRQDVTHIVFQHYRSFSTYSERETVAASHLGIGAIRHLRALGLIEGVETGGEVRYSEEEVIQLRRIRRLQRDLGVNLAGVEVILSLLKRLETVHQELEQERKKEYRNETSIPPVPPSENQAKTSSAADKGTGKA
jgi:MerR family transcriptional regulator/heat shock protein HspR